MTFPPWSPATQSGSDAHETAGGPPRPSTKVLFQSAAPPVGFVDAKADPPSSMTTHSDDEAHDTPCSSSKLSAPDSTDTDFHAVPDPGEVELSTEPFSLPVVVSSTARQSDEDGFDTEWFRRVVSIPACRVHVPFGVFVDAELPWLSTATQKETDGHETAVKPCPGSTATGALHFVAPPVGS